MVILSAWKCLECRILHHLPQSFWGPRRPPDPRPNWLIRHFSFFCHFAKSCLKGTMDFVNLFPFRIFLPWIIPGRFHFALMTSYPIIVHQDWRGSKLGKVYYKICFSFQNIVITFKNTLKWFYVNVLSNLWNKKLFKKFVPIYSMLISCRQGKLT